MLAHITFTPHVVTFLDVVRVAFSTAFSLVSILVGVSALVKFVWLWEDRKTKQEEKRLYLDLLRHRARLAEKGWYASEQERIKLTCDLAAAEMIARSGPTPVLNVEQVEERP